MDQKETALSLISESKSYEIKVVNVLLSEQNINMMYHHLRHLTVSRYRDTH